MADGRESPAPDTGWKEPPHEPAEISDKFRDEFKRYKRRDRQPDLSEVVDFSDLGSRDSVERYPLMSPVFPPLKGLMPVSDWKAYCLNGFPGFVFIVNPFETGYQRYWAFRCLHDYPCSPNITNLGIEQHAGSLWDTSHTFSSECKDKDISRLRWVTLGYHYDWDSKEYSKDRVSTFPEDLSYLARYVASAIGYSNFSPEAAIVNFYHFNSTLAGHTDHSEFDLTAPLLSLSLGQDAVFLLGGLSKAMKPVALFLRSGDICIMSGECRLAFHAVPKIFPSETWLYSFCKTSEDTHHERGNQKLNLTDQIAITVLKINGEIEQTLESMSWEDYEKYLKKSRININIRQVLKHGQTFPDV